MKAHFLLRSAVFLSAMISFSIICFDEDGALFRGGVAPANTTTYTINRSGVYTLSCAKSALGVPAISITANNVVLDLAGNAITGGTDGIQVTGNNVSIKNGMISGMVNNGIAIQGNGCRVENCDLVSCTTGITLQGAQACVLENCRVRSATQAGISLVSTWTSSVSACQFVGLSGAQSVYGVVAQGGGNNTVNQCLIQEVSTRSSTGSDKVVGIALSGETASSVCANDIQSVESLSTVSAYGVWVNGGNAVCLTGNSVFGVTTMNGRGQGVLVNQAQSYVASNRCFACDRYFSGVASQFITSQANDRGVYNIDTSLTTSDVVQVMYEQQIPTIESKLDVLVPESYTVESKLDYWTTCDNAPITQPATLSTSYGAYCLTQDMSGDFAITGSGIVLCLNGHTISGGTNGIIISGDEVIVKNGTVRTASASGIKITGNKCELEDITSVGNVTGFELSGASNAVLDSCLAIDNTREGFLLSNAQKNRLQRCEAINTSGASMTAGFKTAGGTDNSFNDCKVNGVTSSGADAYGMLGVCETQAAIADCVVMNVSGAKYVAGIGLLGDYLGTPTVADFRFTMTGYATSVSWLNSPVGTFLATSDAATSLPPRFVRVALFSPSSGLSLAAQASPLTGYAYGVDWLSWNNGLYLAVAGQGTGSGNDLYVMQFDPSVNTLTAIDSAGYSSVSFALSVDWLVSGSLPYLALSGTFKSSGNELSVLAFDGVSLTGVVTAKLGVSSYVVRAHNYQGLWKLAVGLDRSVTTSAVMQMYEFDNPQGSGNLTLKTTLTTSTAGNVRTLSWLDFDAQTYLALGIDDNASAPVVRVLRYDETATTSLTQVATFNYGAAVNGVDWLVTGTNVYLAVAGSLDGQEVKVLQFDPYASTLSSVFNYNDRDKTAAYGISWNRVLSYPSRVYLAVGLDGSALTGTGARVLGFNINDQSSLSVINDITVSGVPGGNGVALDPLLNAAYDNAAYNCQLGFEPNIQTSYVGFPFDSSNRAVV